MKALWLRISTHIVVMLLGVLGGVLSVYLVYPLRSYLSRDRITIEEVEVIPEKTQFEFPREEFSKLRSWLLDAYDRTFSLHYLRIPLQKEENILNEYEIKTMKSRVEEYQDYLNQIQLKINDLPPNNPDQIAMKLESLFRFHFIHHDLLKALR